jgi:uncharacterized protein YhbP (UPF0306 family)
MDIQKLIREHIAKVEVMQLATCINNQPWACTVHFAYDDDLRHFYWFSKDDTRHSQEVASNPHVSVAMAIKTDWPVIGVQIEGDAEQMTDKAEIERVARNFAERHKREPAFVQGVLDGTNGFKPYCLTPRSIQIFDTQNSPKEPKQVWEIK